ncbi:hypothetical protein LQZ19_06955 [Treponema primitia]|uniref:TIGR03943 family putative permease subunit n=1 Tax=Treponema primitia TaxID=88058 RepID=UPI00397ECACA
MKRIVIAGLISFIVFAGCDGNRKIGTIKPNKAGTQSVNIQWPAVENVSETYITIPEDGAVFQNPLSPTGGEIVEIKEKMFLAQTNDVYLNPEDYLGKTIKLEGLFKSQYYAENDAAYCFVLRYGPGCCGNDGNAGFEIAWDSSDLSDLKNPQYPEDDAWVEAVGVLSSYEEEGYPYLYIALSSLMVKEERGEEFVAQ